jgi:ABC-type transporter Mla subunit MlaD
MRRGGTSIAANPVLIGAVTVLVVIVAVYLSYNANSGLPFVPTYDLKAEVPNAAGLVKGNDVRVGGTRVGTVSCIEPQTQPSGEVIAVLCLKLETVVNPLPTDTRVRIRPRSALGLKYVQLTRGASEQDLPANSTIPLRQALPEPVELDEFFDMFNAPTRRAIQGNLTNFGNGFASRGSDINLTLRGLNPLLDDLEPVMRNLASAETDLKGFWEGLLKSASAVAPVAEIQGEMFRNLDRTFTAWAEVADPYLKETISEGPPTLRAGIRDLPVIQPFLANTATLFEALEPGFVEFAEAAPDLAAAVTAGVPALEDSPAFNQRLTTTFTNLREFATDPLVRLGTQDLIATTSVANPLLSFVTPAQVTCNYLGLFFRNLAVAFTEGGTNGQTLRVSIVAAPGGQPVPNQPNIDNTLLAPNNEGSPSSAPANGPTGAGFDASNFLHSNPYPFTAAPGQPKSCEAGNEQFRVGKQTIGNVPGQAPTTLHFPTKP